MQEIVVTSAEAGMRLDLLLARRFAQFSRGYFQQLIKKGAVQLLGGGAKKSTLPRGGERILLQLLVPPPLTPQPLPLAILYEDADLIVIDKPAGMVTHPGPGHPDRTVVNALLAHCSLPPADDQRRPGIVHRLDKETSGVLLAAKTPLAYQGLRQQFAMRAIKKRYFAICRGHPQQQTITAPIARRLYNRQLLGVSPQGKAAITIIEQVQPYPHFSLLQLQTITGRTHQIRVHLQYIGHPLLGDRAYGSAAKSDPQPHLLHAAAIACRHPISGTPLQIQVPLPENFRIFLDRFAPAQHPRGVPPF